MPAAADSLLLAHARRVLDGEDRLTELLAVVLARDPEAALAMANLAGLALPSGPFAVSVETQLLRAGGNPDLQIVLKSDTDSRVWVEHKIDAPFQPEQMQRYADALRALPGTNRLAVLLPTDRVLSVRETQEITAAGARVIRWASLARALRGDTNATPTRAEFLAYLRQRHDHRRLDVMDEPLTHLHIVAARYMSAYQEVAAELASEAARRITSAGSARVATEWEEAGWRGVTFTHSEIDGWFAPLKATLELEVGLSDTWNTSRSGEPSLGAGLSVEVPARRDLEGEMSGGELRSWSDGLSARGFSVSHAAKGDPYLRIYRTKSLAELLSQGATLDRQAQAAADWATAAFDVVVAQPAPPG